MSEGWPELTVVTEGRCGCTGAQARGCQRGDRERWRWKKMGATRLQYVLDVGTPRLAEHAPDFTGCLR